MAVSPVYLEIRDALLLQAALVEEFQPRALLRQVMPEEFSKNILMQGQLMSALREVCVKSRNSWHMRPNDRRKILRELKYKDALPDTEITEALRGLSMYSPAGLQKMIMGSSEIDMLSKAVSTLEQAGPAAPGHKKLLALSSKLDHVRKEQATDELLGGGFVGRDDEIGRLIRAIEEPQRNAPLRTLHIRGLPGVGKTFLLEQLTKLTRDRARVVMIRLDFDRSSLREGAADAVFDEISRQLATAIPDVASELHELRLEEAERRTQIATQSQPGVPLELLHSMINILAHRDRHVLFLLDTLEVLHGYGPTFVMQLMEHIDRFADKERLDITVISAGRGPVFEQSDKRLLDLIPLEKLDQEIAELILTRRDVPEDMRPRIINLAKGNPLRLILLTRAAQDAEGQVLGDAQIDDADTGYLYRAILSRVPSDIREIAAEGLILPELGRVELTEIVGPALNISINDTRAIELLDTLEMQRWLVRRKGADALGHTEDVRPELLELTYSNGPENTYAINKRAAEVLAKRDPVRSLYHRLQMTRNGGEMPKIERDLARQLTDDLMEDLPQDAQDAVHRVRGGRSRRASGTVASEAAKPAAKKMKRVAQKKVQRQPVAGIWVKANEDASTDGRLSIVDREGDSSAVSVDPGAIADLRNMLELGETREATFMLKQWFAGPVELSSDAGLLALAHQWQSGHWSMARTLFDQLPDDVIFRSIDEDIGLTGRTLLEMWAEFKFTNLRKCYEDERIRHGVFSALSQTRGGLQGGALGFLHFMMTGEYQTEEVGLVMRYTTDRASSSDMNVAHRSNAIRREYGLSLTEEQVDLNDAAPDIFAQHIAPVNPYAEPLRALLNDVIVEEDSKLATDLMHLRSRISELSMLYSPELSGLSDAEARSGSQLGDIAQLFNALGLTAEFSTGYSFFSPIPDLPTIARAAERWQQATLGIWRYSKQTPRDWINPKFDPLVMARAERLMFDKNAEQRARRMILIWHNTNPVGDAQRSPILNRRVDNIYAELAELFDLSDRLKRLQRSSIPSVLQAPLAVLSQLGVTKRGITQRGS